MKPKIAIQPDRPSIKDDIHHHSFKRWIELCEQKGWIYELVDVYNNDDVARIPSFDAFLWRVGPYPSDRLRMEKLASIYESYSDLLIYPSSRTLFTKSKLDQAIIFNFLGIPSPKTYLFYDKESALSFCETATYPLVTKLETGNQSTNVALLNTKADAETLIKGIFDSGVKNIHSKHGEFLKPPPLKTFVDYRLKPSAKILLGYPYHEIIWGEKHDTGYFYAQEYIRQNDHDTRITVIGNRAFGFTRGNRDNDFRASGSGRIDWDPEKVNPELIHLAFDITKKLGTQTNAMDFIYNEGRPVLLECNLSFAAWAIERCPGHWLRGENDQLTWTQGCSKPEDLIFDDLATELLRKGYT